ncbi:hypothetical protein BVRB_7g179570 [Beta vulgaris subsp. vulgaris]|uniref:Uncharacterized protein n=2 Tax=Beta vulgaris subsp. vulgaris TaxID=3555 RepID=A0A0J8B701_BETVV|nr:hypothetical protein BVRB_7g179570 [Beta vulgaris subsp. vulgaris]
MDILVVKRSNGIFLSYYNFSSNSFNISVSSKSFKTYCSTNNSQQPQRNGDDDDSAKDNKSGGKFSTDWDKAWSSFKRQGKKSLLSQFSPNKYVTWNPRRSNYPLSEEVDPIKRTERSNLMLWTSPRFTLGVAIVIVSLLLLYTILAPMK